MPEDKEVNDSLVKQNPGEEIKSNNNDTEPNKLEENLKQNFAQNKDDKDEQIQVNINDRKHANIFFFIVFIILIFVFVFPKKPNSGKDTYDFHNININGNIFLKRVY